MTENNVIVLNVLCEGQTEELFVQKVLRPYLSHYNIVVKSRILFTNIKLNKRGGIVNFAQVERDLNYWISEVKKSGEKHYYTTMIDFYGLPKDFPSFESCKKITDKYLLIESLESAFDAAISNAYFIPYIQLHEFESLVFCGIDHLIQLYPRAEREARTLIDVLTQFDNAPELINNNPETAPSKRIIAAIEGQKKYKYNKPQTGKVVTENVGIDKLRAMCPHFGKWVDKQVSLN